MKIYEKYADEIREYKGDYFCNDFVKPNILKSDCCDGVNCSRCYMLQTMWLMEDYEEPEKPEEPKVDWSKVPVDTPILVSDVYKEKWYTRHFAKYEDGVVYTWKSGRTSRTEDCTIEWAFAKLIENEEEPEIDWSKVKVDTPILVRHRLDGEWEKRHFANYENGDVYAWDNGRTSWTVANEIKWNYAKLAESEETK